MNNEKKTKSVKIVVICQAHLILAVLNDLDAPSVSESCGPNVVVSINFEIRTNLINGLRTYLDSVSIGFVRDCRRSLSEVLIVSSKLILLLQSNLVHYNFINSSVTALCC